MKAYTCSCNYIKVSAGLQWPGQKFNAVLPVLFMGHHVYVVILSASTCMYVHSSCVLCFNVIGSSSTTLCFNNAIILYILILNIFKHPDKITLIGILKYGEIGNNRANSLIYSIAI